MKIYDKMNDVIALWVNTIPLERGADTVTSKCENGSPVVVIECGAFGTPERAWEDFLDKFWSYAAGGKKIYWRILPRIEVAGGKYRVYARCYV